MSILSSENNGLLFWVCAIYLIVLNFTTSYCSQKQHSASRYSCLLNIELNAVLNGVVAINAV